jgi:glucose/arabinose dehydrogenase
MNRFVRSVFGLALLPATLQMSLPALAAPPTVTIRQVASGINAPVEITNAGDGSNRLFIVEKGGAIRILKNGTVNATSFLNVSGLISTSGERGLLGLAFDPNFRTNRRFFVFYTRSSDGALTLATYLASTGNPDVADTSTAQVLTTVPHPGQDNHNGGKIAFGPDGYLYMSIGDGGSQGDPNNNAQNLTVRLGKILRVDVRTNPGSVLTPPTNPFVGMGGGVQDTIWAYGLRNPWKFSFDRATGDLFIGDVGGGTAEEVDYQPAGSAGGQNYGWRVYEGNGCHNPSSGCSLANHTPPVVTYGHVQGNLSITGGYMYRGTASAGLRGYYVYGDYGSNRIWALQKNGAVWNNFVLTEPPTGLSGLTSFGEDESGELYMASINNGRIYALDGAGPRYGIRNDLHADGRSDILWYNTATGQSFGLPMNGITPETGALLYTEPNLNWAFKIAGDFNGDGRADMLWRNSVTGEYYGFLMNGFAAQSQGSVTQVNPGSGWALVATGDVDGDGRHDLVWRRSTTGEVLVMFLNGLSVTSSQVVYTEPSTNWNIVAAADFNGDSRADFLWRNSATGDVFVQLMNGATSIGGGVFYTEPDANWQIQAAADFNGDGRADILWRNALTGDVFMMLMNGAAIASGAVFYNEPNTNWKIVGAGDYNGNGRADILWRNTATGDVFLMLMNGATIVSGAVIYGEPDQNWQVVGP